MLLVIRTMYFKSKHDPFLTVTKCFWGWSYITVLRYNKKFYPKKHQVATERHVQSQPVICRNVHCQQLFCWLCWEWLTVIVNTYVWGWDVWLGLNTELKHCKDKTILFKPFVFKRVTVIIWCFTCTCAGYCQNWWNTYFCSFAGVSSQLFNIFSQLFFSLRAQRTLTHLR